LTEIGDRLHGPLARAQNRTVHLIGLLDTGIEGNGVDADALDIALAKQELRRIERHAGKTQASWLDVPFR